MRKENTTLRALKRYASSNPMYFPVKAAQTLFELLSPYYSLWMSAAIVNALYEEKAAAEISVLVIATLLGNLLLRICAAALKRSAQSHLEKLESNEAAAMNFKTLSLDYDKLENPQIRQHRRRILENSWINGYGTHQLRRVVERLIQNGITLLLSLILFAEMFSLMIRADFQPLSLVLMAGLMSSFAGSVFLGNRMTRLEETHWKKVGEFMLEENRIDKGMELSGTDCRIYRQRFLVNRINERMAKIHLKLFSEARYKTFQLQTPIVIAERLSELFSYLLICFYCAMGIFPIGSLMKYIGYLSKASAALWQILLDLRSTATNEPYLADYLAYFAIPNDMYQGSLSVEKRSDRQFEIEFRDVSFRYAGADTAAVSHVSLNLKVGERLAVVGMNGSGKTTFIKLLCRLYDPTEGEILMNDFNIRKYDYRQYLDLFSVVFQDFKLLSVPLGCNVASDAEWDSERAEFLLRRAGFGERYDAMPKGMETPLYKDFDEDGVNVSGGEAQKIALARALYRDAPFIILDEPTAALDPVAEADIYARFDEIVGDRTAIYISHRLSSCRFCDRIAVFDQGRIVQMGTHEELLADTDGKYYELWNAQAQYYTEETA